MAESRAMLAALPMAASLLFQALRSVVMTRGKFLVAVGVTAWALGTAPAWAQRERGGGAETTGSASDRSSGGSSTSSGGGGSTTSSGGGSSSSSSSGGG